MLTKSHCSFPTQAWLQSTGACVVVVVGREVVVVVVAVVKLAIVAIKIASFHIFSLNEAQLIEHCSSPSEWLINCVKSLIACKGP